LDTYKIDTPGRIAIEEAAAWGKTTLEIIRPLLLEGKPLPEGQVKLSDRLQKFHDDYRNPGWIQIFRVRDHVARQP
jgi:hypothetical protein